MGCVGMACHIRTKPITSPRTSTPTFTTRHSLPHGTTTATSAAVLATGGSAASPGLGTSPNPILAGIPFYTNGLGIGGVNGIPKGLVNNTWKNFGPRVGFAYDPTGQAKTIARRGFGLLFDRVQGNDMYNCD